ncbi:hypothetical protein [Phytomonospora endophytica]|uniref:Uncharacterized protein n=1 Tax=Phytomonospora endophytica TaxID=714109 RepID=A0A841FQ48_9ACTN|nr:hypothetical protein [Phytomonospora endophytica]MBB6034080.1 hypothetical protein [Phytomonospora endophytica]GIG66474.1 hypothetical protein Pen01_27690 [Phytomonospora endophytica]
MNERTLPAAAAALLRGVAEPDWARLLTGARLGAGILRHDPPDSLIDHVLATGDPAQLAILAESNVALHGRPGLTDRLVADVEPAVLWKPLLTTRQWQYRHLEAVLRRIDPADPGWESADTAGDSHRLSDDMVSVLAHSPLPGHYLDPRVDSRRRRLTEREQITALARLHADGGEDDGRYEPEVTARFTAAAEAGEVRALLAELDGTDAAITAFRTDTGVLRVRTHARERAELDWDRVAAAHAEDPFSATTSAVLASRGDCPEAVRAALYASHPAEVAERAATSFPALFAVPGSGPEHARGARRLITRMRDRGLIEELVAHGRPATAVLDIARHSSECLDAATWLLTPVHTLVARILAETVGADPAAWRGLRRLLKGHRGTIAELCAAATAAPEPDGPWPDAAPLPGRDAAPIGARKAFLALLDAAGPATQAALIPHLDPRTLVDLFAHGVWRSEWFGLVTDHGTPVRRAAFARTRGPLTTAQIQRLLDFGEPGLGRALLARHDLTAAQTAQALTGLDAPPRRLPAVVARPELAALDAGTAFTEVFAGHRPDGHDNADWTHAGLSWVRSAVATGRVTWTEILNDAAPAGIVLSLVRQAHPVDALPALREVVGSAKPTTEALFLALGMLADFTGTVPELLAIASAAADPG